MNGDTAVAAFEAVKLYAVDIWLIGCVMGELLQGYPLLDGTSEIDQIYKITKLLGGLSSNQLYRYSQEQYQSLRCGE